MLAHATQHLAVLRIEELSLLEIICESFLGE